MARAATLVAFLTLLQYTHTIARHGEPHCPQLDRFSFEEKMLEKMVRVEHKLELMEEKLKVWDKGFSAKMADMDDAEVEMEKSVEEKLAQLEADITAKIQEFDKAENDRKAALKTHTENLNKQTQEQSERLAAAIGDVKTQLDGLVKSVEDKQAEVDKQLAAALKTHTDDLKTIKEQYQGPTVAFHATQTADTSLNQEHFIFNIVNLNMGGAYDSSTGIFTTPMEGVYSFTVQLCGHTDKLLRAKIKTSEGMIVAALYFWDKNYNGLCRSSSGVAHLKKEETVSVEGFIGSFEKTMLMVTPLIFSLGYSLIALDQY